MATIRKTRTFTDLNLDFLAHPRTRDVVKKTDEDAVKTSLINLVRTQLYERPFHPEISCQIFSMLFENFTPITALVAKKTIEDVIKKFEPRVNLLEVLVNDKPDENGMEVSITFKLQNSPLPVTVSTILFRAR